MSALELAQHLAIRLHQLKMHRGPFSHCEDWECRGNRDQIERLTQVEESRQEGAA